MTLSRLTKQLLAALAVVTATSFGTANAASVTYSNAAELAAYSSATTTIDFNFGGSGETLHGTSWTVSGVTFRADGSVFHIRDATFDAAYHRDGYLDLEGSNLGMDFGSPVTAAGFDFGDIFSDIVHLSITLDNGDMFNVSSPSNAYGYFGVSSDEAFRSLSITTTNLFTAFDNVTFAPAATEVPEPSSLALLGLGLGIAGFAAARRSKGA